MSTLYSPGGGGTYIQISLVVIISGVRLQHRSRSPEAEAETQRQERQEEGEELRWMQEVAEERRHPETAAFVAVAGPFVGSIGSKRHSSGSHHTRRTGQPRNIAHTARYNQLGYR